VSFANLSLRCRNSRLSGYGPVLLFVAMLSVVSTGCQWAAVGQNVEGTRRFAQGDFLGAANRFREAIENDPNNPDGYYNLAATYHSQGIKSGNKAHLQQAENFYNQCLDRDPNHRDCYRGLAVLLTEMGDSEKSFRLLEGWVGRSPTSAEARIELARLNQEFAQRDKAKELLTEAVELDPTNQRAQAAIGQIYEETGNREQALICYQRSLRQNPFQPQLRTRVASLQRTVGPATPSLTPAGGTRVVNAPEVKVDIR